MHLRLLFEFLKLKHKVIFHLVFSDKKITQKASACSDCQGIKLGKISGISLAIGFS